MSCLLEHWAGSAQARAHRFTLFAHHAIPSLPPSLEVSQVLLPGSGGTRWEQGTLAVALRRATPDRFAADMLGQVLAEQESS